MRRLATVGALLLVGLAVLCGRSTAEQERFSELVGPVRFGTVPAGQPLRLPFLTWGGDVATFHANGGLKTKGGSLFNKLGLKVELTPGDDFVAQVRNYVTGKTPFLRGTISQLAQASEVLNRDARCQPVVFLQLTWSKGDHMVARQQYKTLNDLVGKRKLKVALQAGGPHVGMLDDVLQTAGLKWQQLELVWTKEPTGDDGPAEVFRKDPTVDACFVISPDMYGLTGGLDKVGTGAETTVKGARVLISTRTMKRSIADVYACRKDFFDANKALVEKLAAGYLKGCEEVLALKVRVAKRDKKAIAAYAEILQLAQDIYGEKVLPNDAEADKFIADAQFVGLPGNRAFFKDEGNLSGFEARMDAALQMAVREGWAARRAPLLAVNFDYEAIKRLGRLTADPNQGRVSPAAGNRGAPVFSFVIAFKVNQADFSEEEYGKDFQRATELASLFGNSDIEVRGHTDTTALLGTFVKASLANRVLRREGEKPNFRYYLKDGALLDLTSAQTLKVIEALIGKEVYPRAVVKLLAECRRLSDERARTVRDALVRYAANHKLVLDLDQIKSAGASVFEPVVVRPRNDVEAARNRRVEFRIYKLQDDGKPVAESTNFDY